MIYEQSHNITIHDRQYQETLKTIEDCVGLISERLADAKIKRDKQRMIEQRYALNEMLKHWQEVKREYEQYKRKEIR